MSRFLSQFQWSVLVSQTRTVAARFPVEVIVAAGSAIVGVLVAHEVFGTQQSLLTAMLLSSPVLLALQLVVSLVAEQYATPRWWPLVGRTLALAAATAMVASLQSDVGSSAVPVQVATAWSAAVASLMVVWYGKGPAVMWQMTKVLAWRFVLTTVFASVLSGGLALALGAMQVLFGLDLPDALYGDVSALVDTLFVTVFFLAGVPAERREREDVENEHSVPPALRWFVQFALLPLVMVFTVILYAYAIKVAFFSNLEGSVAGYIVALGIISISAWVITWPLRSSGAHRMLAWYHRWLGVVLLPMTVMLIVAVAVRISDYGVTPERYALAAFTTVMVGATVMMLLRRIVDLRALPIVIVGVGAVTALGPFDSRHVSVRSQRARVESILRAERLLDQSGTFDTTAFQQQPDSVRHEIFQRISAVSEVDTTAALRLLQQCGIRATIQASSRDVQFAGMGVRPQWRATERGRYWTFPDTAPPVMDLQGASKLYALRLTNSNSDTTVVIPLDGTATSTATPTEVRLDPKSTVLKIYQEGRRMDSMDMATADNQRRVSSNAGFFRAMILSGEVSPTFVASLQILLLDLRPQTESVQQ